MVVWELIVLIKEGVQQVSKIWPHKISYVNFGDMNYICPHCSVFFWHVEFSKKSCCHFGKVKLPPLTDYDNKMKNLLLYDLNYRQLIRYYNNRFSFASFSANVLNEHKKGIYNLKIQGQACHVTPNSIYARKGETPYGGQIDIYDDYKAIKRRLKDNSRLSKQHMEILSNVLKNINPYAKKYKYLHQLTKNE